MAYWGVAHADSIHARLLSLGATALEPIQDAGGGIRIGAVRDPFGNLLGAVRDPFGNLLGIIENPNLKLP